MKRWEYDNQMADYKAEFEKLRAWKAQVILTNLAAKRRNLRLTIIAFGIALLAFVVSVGSLILRLTTGL